MDRDYKTGKSDSIGIFSGLEVEHTPAYGKQTLFLARNDLTFDRIKQIAETVKAEAIYYGANRTYMHNHGMQIAQMKRFLEHGYFVTVDYDYSIHKEVKEKFTVDKMKEIKLDQNQVIEFAKKAVATRFPEDNLRCYGTMKNLFRFVP